MPTSTQTALTLAQATVKTQYTVAEVSGHDDCSCRLHEMGVAVGSLVILEKRGNPSLVRIGNSKLALSTDCLSRIHVEPIV